MLLILVVPRPTSADVILFTSESDFLAAAGALVFEGFEDTAPGQIGSSRVLDHFIVSDPGGSGLLEIINDPAVAAEGSQALGGATAMDFFAFVTSPRAFGFTVLGFGDEGPNTLTLELATLAGVFATIPLASSDDPFSPFRFFGVISSTPFQQVRISHENEQDFLTVDAVWSGAAVPEPGAGLLLACAAAVLAGRRYCQGKREKGTSKV